MITLSNMAICNSENKVYLFSKENLIFEDNTLYFIIGKSGYGKTSIIDFITAPFTEDPIKNGTIEIAEANDKKKKEFFIENSHCNFIANKKYFDFVKTHIAFIPQKTDSFHPEIPVIKQMFNLYKTALNRNIFDWRYRDTDWENFKNALTKYSKFAGWENVSTLDKETLKIEEKSSYWDTDNNIPKYSVPKDENESDKKVWQQKFSSGQKQRLLILNGLLQFSVMKNPILVADEFLVNFSYQEANDVLKNIISLFSDTDLSGKTSGRCGTGIFILHDLSFPALKNIPSNLKVKLIALERKPYKGDDQKYIKYCGELCFHEIPLADFFAEKWETGSEKGKIFSPFLQSYREEPIEKCHISINASCENLYDKITIEKPPDDRPPNLYANKSGDFEITIRQNKFIVITGFSGVGKSTLCEQILKKLKKDGKEQTNFRYVPANLLSALSDDGNSTVYQDLSLMYAHYNDITDIRRDEIREAIEAQISKTHLLDVDEFPGVSAKDLIKWHIFDLSGGQQQRYWLMRLLLDHFPDESHIRPQMLVLDESIASLDCQTKNAIIKTILEDYFSEKGCTILLISHDKRDISVIYKTLQENLPNGKISEVFEHYELFHGMLYRINASYTDYAGNLENGVRNEYESCQEKNKKQIRHFARDNSRR